jgi:ketosteroid isomerase-like protein
MANLEANKRAVTELFARLRDGKIASVHEYLDTQHTFDVWLKR